MKIKVSQKLLVTPSKVDVTIPANAVPRCSLATMTSSTAEALPAAADSFRAEHNELSRETGFRIPSVASFLTRSPSILLYSISLSRLI